jgi:hypothetical protein
MRFPITREWRWRGQGETPHPSLKRSVGVAALEKEREFTLNAGIALIYKKR